MGRALIRIYETLSRLMLSGKLAAPAEGHVVAEEQQEQVTVLCVAYHNLAVEQEYLKNIEGAASSYAEGLGWAARFLPVGHQLNEVMRKSLKAVIDRLPATSRTRVRIEAVLADLDQPAGVDGNNTAHRDESDGADPNGKMTHRSNASESTPQSNRPTSRGPLEQWLTPRADGGSPHFGDDVDTDQWLRPK